MLSEIMSILRTFLLVRLADLQFSLTLMANQYLLKLPVSILNRMDQSSNPKCTVRSKSSNAMHHLYYNSRRCGGHHELRRLQCGGPTHVYPFCHVPILQLEVIQAKSITYNLGDNSRKLIVSGDLQKITLVPWAQSSPSSTWWHLQNVRCYCIVHVLLQSS